MDVISYRGPGVAGGVSSAIGNAWKNQSIRLSKWWYINNSALESIAAAGAENNKSSISELPNSLIGGHYRYCNEFIWPVMHDLPQYAVYSAEDHEHFNAFNNVVAKRIDAQSPAKQKFFIQDYQLSLNAKLLALHGHRAVMFWHVPWPKHVPAQYSVPICELALGILGASVLGFHIKEYAENFIDFVNLHLPEFRVNRAAMTVELRDPNELRSSSRQGMCSVRNNSTRNSTQLIVRPLGVDLPYWAESKSTGLKMDVKTEWQELAKSIFVLSVDRVDYTKSVLDRFQTINSFFDEHPHWIGNLSFVQVCGRVRAGLAAFDRYWNDCRSLAEEINGSRQRDGWQPIKWIDQTLSSEELAYLYANANSMLVNPIRDGLNLTAKEFVACQGNQPGVLLLSSGAGAFCELGEFALRVSPNDHASTIDSVARSLTMPLEERHERMLAMKTSIAENQLLDWWSTFSTC